MAASDKNKEQSALPENRLKDAASPYLLQHKHNPVDWYEWSDEAFERARQEDKPVFLSIGYSTCHWCHVMAHESFEDEEVAALLNDAFINIKVDREERPDIDNIYMTACQMMGQRGGWPLTVLMTPDKKPFFIATYIPKSGFGQRPGLMQLIPALKNAWLTRREEIVNSADQVVAALQREPSEQGSEPLEAGALDSAYQYFLRSFDRTHGGFGTAPKFPTPHNLMFLLRYWKRSNDPQVLQMVETTLIQMRWGGVFDHVGFGFHRYSTDHKWFLPHFEKMLYDQALLALAYLEAYQATSKPEYADTAREIFTYVLRDMVDPAGGFYSAEDADSEGEEGKFYLWERKEVLDILGEDAGTLYADVYHITEEGTYYEEATGHRSTSSIPHLQKSLAEIASGRSLTEKQLREQLETLREKLFVVRERRIHPHKDDKVLTDWNGLMIAALARAGRVLKDPEYTRAAQKAAAFIKSSMRTDSGRLLHRYRSGQAGLQASVDDYAFVIWGLLELYEATFDLSHLQWAIELEEIVRENFWDEKAGGYFFSPDDGERLIARQKEIYDGAVPSGNSVMSLNLVRLSRLTGNMDYEKRAITIGTVFSSQVTGREGAYSLLMCGLDFQIGPSHEIVIAADNAVDATAMLASLQQPFLPNKVVHLRHKKNAAALSSIAPYTELQEPIDNQATAYICQDFACKSPTTQISDLTSSLNIDRQE